MTEASGPEGSATQDVTRRLLSLSLMVRAGPQTLAVLECW